MELVKSNVNCLEEICSFSMPVTLDDYHNISDTLPDVDMMLKENGAIRNVSIKEIDGKIAVLGTLFYNILYLSKDKSNLVNQIEGEIHFKEFLGDACKGNVDFEDIRCSLEDIKVKIINSRKLGIRAIIEINTRLNEVKTKEVVNEVCEEVNKLKENVSVTELVVCKKDILNIKVSGQLGAGNADVKKVLYKDVMLGERDVRVIDGALCIRGNINVFVIYEAEGDENILWYETTLPFDEVLSVREIGEGMLPECRISMDEYSLNIGRNIELEAVLKLDIKAYEDKSICNVKDIYDPAKEYIVENERLNLSKVLTHNKSKCQVNESFLAKGDGSILILVHSMADAYISDSVIVDNGIVVNGHINVWSIVSMADDDEPFGVVSGQIPFTHRVEANGIVADDLYSYDVYIEHLTVEMISDSEYRVRATIVIDTMVTKNVCVDTIKEVREIPFDTDSYIKLPGIVGIVVKEGDTLWNIAKRFHTSPESIIDINHRKSDEVRVGEKLIIVKKGS